MGRNWAITVGIDNYYNLTPLRYAQRDAEAFRDFCLNEAGFEGVYHFGEDVAPIPTERGPALRAEPTVGNLERFLRVRFERKFLEPGDNLWFFFAGHGRRVGGRDYLMPLDGDPDNVGRTAFAIRDIADRLRRSGADNVLMAIDACRGEDDRSGGTGIGGEQQQGVITLFSCSPQELAYEIEPLQAGSFTYALLEGLRIRGENNCATVERLCQHLRYRVPELNQRHGKPRQTPYPIAEPATKLHLILLPQQATLQDVQALKNDALEAEIEGDWDQAEQLWIRVLAASPADRQAIKAIQRIAVRQATTSPGPTAPLSETLPLSDATESRSPTPPAPTPPPKPPAPTFRFEVVTVGAKGKIVKRAAGSAEYRRETLPGGVVLDVVPIPAGEFWMGQTEAEKAELIRQAGEENYQKYYARENPRHRVQVPSFWLGKYAVTQAQWRAIAGLPKVKIDLKADPSQFKGDDLPVEHVSWDEAVEFCDRLTHHTNHPYHLPTEAEWEYACRGGSETPFYFGETITPELVNYNGNYPYSQAPKGTYRQKTTPVGSFPPNRYGLYDMHGNVWEWCQDHWHENYEGAPNDGSAWLSSDERKARLGRGGSWVNNARNCRCAIRFRYEPDLRLDVLGFRVAASSAWTV